MNIKEFKRPENFDWYDDYLQSDISVMLPCFLFEWNFDYGEEILLPLEDGRIRRFHDIWPNDLRYDFHDRYLRLNHSGNRGNNKTLFFKQRPILSVQSISVPVPFRNPVFAINLFH